MLYSIFDYLTIYKGIFLSVSSLILYCIDEKVEKKSSNILFKKSKENWTNVDNLKMANESVSKTKWTKTKTINYKY